MKNKKRRLILLEITAIIMLAFSALLAMLFLPYNKQFGYHKMLESCGRNNWLYSRIFLNKMPVGIAFIGSSRTICSVQDSLLEIIVSEKNNKEINIANLGFCRYGRPLHYAIIKDLLAHHAPKIIVLEIREKESRSSHPDFAHIADENDLLFSGFNNEYLTQIIAAAQDRLEYNGEYILGEFQPSVNNMDMVAHHPEFHPEKADPQRLATRKNKNKNSPRLDGIEKNWVYGFSKSYVQKIAQMAAEKGIFLKFIYLPAYGANEELPTQYDFYKQFGEVYIPPDSILQNPEYRADEDHLNWYGARALTEWLGPRMPK